MLFTKITRERRHACDRARAYDPTTGRFLAVDPKAPQANDPAASDYLYTADDPTLFVDPSGESMICDENGDCRVVGSSANVYVQQQTPTGQESNQLVYTALPSSQNDGGGSSSAGGPATGHAPLRKHHSHEPSVLCASCHRNQNGAWQTQNGPPAWLGAVRLPQMHNPGPGSGPGQSANVKPIPIDPAIYAVLSPFQRKLVEAAYQAFRLAISLNIQ